MKFLVLLLLGLLCGSMLVTPTIASEEEIEIDEADEEVGEEGEEAEGEEGSEEEEVLDDDLDDRELGSSDSVVIDSLLPDHPDFEVVPGVPNEILFAFTNKGAKPVFITTAQAYLHYHQFWEYYFENYTLTGYDTVVQPGEQATISYFFAVHPMVEAGSYHFSSRVWYHDKDGGNFTNLALNATLEIVNPENDLDIQTLALFTSVVATAVAVVYYVIRSKDSKKRGSRVERGTTSSTVSDDSWLEGTAYDPSKKKGNKKR